MIRKTFLLLSFCFLTSTNSHSSTLPDYNFEKVSDHTWVIHGPLEMPNVKNQGFMNNPAAVITNKGVVIVDPGSSVQAGEMVLRALKKISKQAVVAVFNTHVHGDHWLGNQAIKAAYPKVKIYGHPNMIQAIKNGEGTTWVNLMDTLTEGATKGTTVVAPTLAVNNNDNIKIGDFNFKVHNYGQAHTITDIMIEVKKDSIVFLGDNVLFQRIPRMTDGNFKASVATIDEILKTQSKYWVPGHGKTGTTADVKQYKNYLSTVYKVSKKAFDDDLDSSDIKLILRKATSSYKNWSGYEDEFAKHGAQAYMEIEAAEF